LLNIGHIIECIKYVAAHKQIGADHIPWSDPSVPPQQAYGLVAFECETKSYWLPHAYCKV